MMAKRRKKAAVGVWGIVNARQRGETGVGWLAGRRGLKKAIMADDESRINSPLLDRRRAVGWAWQQQLCRMRSRRWLQRCLRRQWCYWCSYIISGYHSFFCLQHSPSIRGLSGSWTLRTSRPVLPPRYRSPSRERAVACPASAPSPLVLSSIFLGVNPQCHPVRHHRFFDFFFPSPVLFRCPTCEAEALRTPGGCYWVGVARVPPASGDWRSELFVACSSLGPRGSLHL